MLTKYESKVLLRKRVKPNCLRCICETEWIWCSNRSLHGMEGVRVVFAKPSGFDSRIGVVLAWKERKRCINIIQTTNNVQFSGKFMKYESKVLLHETRNHGRISEMLMKSNWCLHAWTERESGLNIFRMRNRDRISETFTKCESKVLLRKSVNHVLTYFRREIVVRSLERSRIVMALKEHESCYTIFRTKSRLGLINVHKEKSRLDLRNVHEVRVNSLVTQERQSCPNIFRTRNRGRISEMFTKYEPKVLLRKIAKSRSDLRNIDKVRVKSLVAQERESCLNMFQMINHGRISETLNKSESKFLLRKSTEVPKANGAPRPGRLAECLASRAGSDTRRVSFWRLASRTR
ncbi:uncharacterized protein G2W53_010349 [Senna tora]|uniref:Uncharacterized protein n=1 Tax=Senna tora TaxID=362788 RepID=A0A834WZ36_9FABA|nr:uncharacterized protein G2W53_010349 [Senna tora]